jgi:hypothetical protein
MIRTIEKSSDLIGSRTRDLQAHGKRFYFVFFLTPGCLCGLVVRVPGYGSGDPDSIPGATRFSE